jgi:hypothetical protein
MGFGSMHDGIVIGRSKPGIVKLTHDLRTAAQFIAFAAAPGRNPLGVGQTVFRQLDNARLATQRLGYLPPGALQISRPPVNRLSRATIDREPMIAVAMTASVAATRIGMRDCNSGVSGIVARFVAEITA